MKVAIVHYWLVGMRGGENVVEALCEMFPQAHVYTNVYRPGRISDRINQQRVRTTFIAKLPGAQRFYKSYLPLMPLALEQLDLREYDLVISSESGPAKGVLTRPDTLHLCYCHTPMRYVWSMYHDYLNNANRVVQLVMPWLIHKLRVWDAQSAARVDFFVANSGNVSRQINKYYRRRAVVIHPPVDIEEFWSSAENGGYYLCVGQLVRYKRFDLAIEACNLLDRPLVIIGEGEEYSSLRRQCGTNVSLMGRQRRDVLARFYARCRALIFPGEEDFGIVPVEAMASGRPVIAYRRGGALETVMPDATGLFFDDQSPSSLAQAILDFEAREQIFDPARIVEHSRRYSRENFKRQMYEAVRQATKATGLELEMVEDGGGTVVPLARTSGKVLAEEIDLPV